MRPRLSYLAVLLLAACTASWGSLVRYSSEPATDSVPIEVYRAALAQVAEGPWPDSIVLQATAAATPHVAGSLTLSPTQVPSHWTDTLRHQTGIALADSALGQPADPEAVARAAASLGITLLASNATAERSGPAQRYLAHIALSRPGFNADSTIAAVYLGLWCGLRCGHGSTLLLARRPGARWQIWYSFQHWVS